MARHGTAWNAVWRGGRMSNGDTDIVSAKRSPLIRKLQGGLKGLVFICYLGRDGDSSSCIERPVGWFCGFRSFMKGEKDT